MVTTPVFITAVAAVAGVAISLMTLVVKMLGDRITDLSGTLTSRFNSVDMRLNSLEGAVRDVGERLTTVESDLRGR